MPATHEERQAQARKARAATATCEGHTRDGSPCGQPAILGRRYCRLHGGKALAGIAHPMYKDGAHIGQREKYRTPREGIAESPAVALHRYRTHLPDHLQVTIETASTDPDIHSLSQEIALSDMTLSDLLRRRYEYGDPGKGWQTLTTLWRQLQASQKQGDIYAMRKAFDAIGPLMEQMQSASHLDAEIREQTRLVASLRMQEHKRIVDLQSHIPPEAFLAVLKRQQLEMRRLCFEYLDAPMAEKLLLAIREAYVRIDIRGLVGVNQPRDVTPHSA